MLQGSPNVLPAGTVTMTTENHGLEPQASSVGDKGNALARAGIGPIPLVGTAAIELFQMLIALPLK